MPKIIFKNWLSVDKVIAKISRLGFDKYRVRQNIAYLVQKAVTVLG